MLDLLNYENNVEQISVKYISIKFRLCYEIFNIYENRENRPQ